MFLVSQKQIHYSKDFKLVTNYLSPAKGGHSTSLGPQTSVGRGARLDLYKAAAMKECEWCVFGTFSISCCRSA